MSKVYIVTAGEYDDYHIEAVFSTEKLAEEYALKFEKNNPYSNIGIEEFEIDEFVGDKVKREE